jgi:EAL domain-containing protein (putative c-di-GMP-specific phosphodiesterase class I)
VVEELEKSQVDSRRICFEITETAAISKLDSAIRFISLLKSKGCRFILDDFGSGLSSFAYLRDLQVDFLKIDGEFVQNMLEDRVKRAMVESINQIGHVMGLQTIAEWVENRQTFDALKELGVDYAQGYWLCRPQPLVHDV